jgi:Na+:H+ antiporter, NhaA family
MIVKLSMRARRAIIGFMSVESASGKVLLAAALLALIIANSRYFETYEAIKALRFGPVTPWFALEKPLILWLNDGLMAIFFLLVGMEIKREFKEGQFQDRRNALLPLIAAAGGMMMPALIYAGVNSGNPDALRGWAIPAATDIAFALGILSLLGSRVSPGLKVLLTAIAVLDDLGAIVIIAIFYTSSLNAAMLLAGIGIAGFMLLLNSRGVTSQWAFLLPGLVLWYCVLKSGVHPTIAGVLTGLMIPMQDRSGEAVLGKLEHALHPFVAFGIMPLFALGNAGLVLDGLSPGDIMAPLPLGIALGLFLGKMIGIFGAAMLTVKLGFAPMPERTNAAQLLGMAMLSGIGFTMSLFIGGLAFEGEAQQNLVRLGVLSGSLISALAGLAFLHLVLPRQRLAVQNG